MSEKLFKPHEIKVMKKVGTILLAGLVLTVAGAAVVGHENAKNVHPYISSQVVPAAAIDPRILAISQRVGISEANLKLAHAQIGSVPGQPAASDLEYSAYLQSNQTIYIYPILFSQPADRQASVVSHEYLHWVWQTKVTNKATFCADLMTYYARPVVKQRMAPYANLTPGSEEFCNELHSVLGSEMRDSEMNPNLVKWYSQWLPNRSALPSYF